LRTQGLQASINATASISSNLDKAFPFNTNHGKPLISVLLLNKPHVQETKAYAIHRTNKRACDGSLAEGSTGHSAEKPRIENGGTKLMQSRVISQTDIGQSRLARIQLPSGEKVFIKLVLEPGYFLGIFELGSMNLSHC
jgi:hypothetical protein